MTGVSSKDCCRSSLLHPHGGLTTGLVHAGQCACGHASFLLFSNLFFSCHAVQILSRTLLFIRQTRMLASQPFKVFLSPLSTPSMPCSCFLQVLKRLLLLSPGSPSNTTSVPDVFFATFGRAAKVNSRAVVTGPNAVLILFWVRLEAGFPSRLTLWIACQAEDPFDRTFVLTVGDGIGRAAHVVRCRSGIRFGCLVEAAGISQSHISLRVECSAVKQARIVQLIQE